MTNQYNHLKDTTELMLREIIGDDVTAEIYDAEKKSLTFTKPLKFWGNQSAEVVYIRNFEDTCILLSQNINQDPKKMTTLAFYRALEVIEQQNKKFNNG